MPPSARLARLDGSIAQANDISYHLPGSKHRNNMLSKEEMVAPRCRRHAAPTALAQPKPLPLRLRQAHVVCALPAAAQAQRYVDHVCASSSSSSSSSSSHAATSAARNKHGPSALRHRPVLPSIPVLARACRWAHTWVFTSPHVCTVRTARDQHRAFFCRASVQAPARRAKWVAATSRRDPRSAGASRIASKPPG